MAGQSVTNVGAIVADISTRFNALAGTIGVSTAALGAFLGVAAALAAVGIGISLWNKHLENQRAAADEASEGFRTMSEDIDGYKERISELKSSLASGNLSDDEAYDVRKELLTIQDELIEKYGQEAEALNILADSADKTNGSLDNMSAAQARRNIEENKEAYEEAAKKMEKQHEYSFNVTQAVRDKDINKAIYDAIGKHDNISIDESRFNGTQLKITGDTTEAQAALNDLYNAILEFGGDGYAADMLKQSIESSLSSLDDTISNFKDRYEDFMLQTIASDTDYSSIMFDVEGYVDAIEDAIAGEDWDALGTAMADLNDIDLSGIENDSVRDYIQGIIDEATANGEAYEAQIEIEANFTSDSENTKAFQEYLKDFTNENGEINVSAIGSMALGDFSDASADQIRSYQMMQIVAGAYGGTVLDVVNHLESLGLVTTQTTTELDAEATSIAEVTEALGNMANAHKTAANAMQEMVSGGLSRDTTLSIMQELTEAGQDWNDYLYEENGKVKLNTAAYLELADAKTKAILSEKYAERDNLLDILGDSSTGTIERTLAQSSLTAVNDEINILEATLNDASNAVSAFFDSFSEGQSKLESVSEIMEAVSTGGITQSQALDWIEKIPELASYYDPLTNTFVNIDSALRSIVTSGYNDFQEQVNDYLSENVDIADEDRAAILSLADAFGDYATQTLASNKALALINKGIKQTDTTAIKFKKQVKNLWNSDQFADARSDLVDLAKKTGITAEDIKTLADDNEYLAAMLDQSGMSASYLAEIFERLSLNGAGALDDITEDAIRMNAVLSEMEGPLAKTAAAYERYQASYGTWDYDDNFNNYQSVYKDLGEMFEGGEFGADFRRNIEYLYGEGHGADNVADLYGWYQKIGNIFSEDDNGLGFIETLYNNQDILAKTGATVKLDKDGNYIWNITPDDFAGIAEGLGITEEAVAACVYSLGMFGDASMFDVDSLVEEFMQLNMALVDSEGNCYASESAFRSMLETLGLESWQIDQIVAKLNEVGNIKFIDPSSQADAENLLSTLQELGKVNINDDQISIDGISSALRESFNMGDSEISAYMQTLDSLGYKFVDVEGNIRRVDNAAANISFDTLVSSAEEAQDALKELTGIDFSFDFNTEDIDQLDRDIDRVRSSIDGMTNADGTVSVGVDENKYWYLVTILDALEAQKDRLNEPAFMRIDASSVDESLQGALTKLQEYQSAVENLNGLIETGADVSEIEAARSTVEGLASDLANIPEMTSLGVELS